MAIDLRFAFVCEKKWSELLGEDPVRRHCPQCSREVVNLDPMSEGERTQLLGDAARSGEKPCVFATIPVENVNPCSIAFSEDLAFLDSVELGGEPMLDDQPGFEDDQDDDIDEILKEIG